MSLLASIGSPKRRREGRALIRRLLFVVFFVEVGLLLIVLPWSAFWEQNYFASAFPPLFPLFTNNFVRGGMTGLGVVNLFAGGAELLTIFVLRDRQLEALRDASNYTNKPNPQVEP